MLEELKNKLLSRKFWVSICGFVTLILTAKGMDSDTSAQITSLIMAGATIVAYVIGQGFTDAAEIKYNSTSATEETVTNTTVVTDTETTGTTTQNVVTSDEQLKEAVAEQVNELVDKAVESAISAAFSKLTGKKEN